MEVPETSKVQSPLAPLAEVVGSWPDLVRSLGDHGVRVRTPGMAAEIMVKQLWWQVVVSKITWKVEHELGTTIHIIVNYIYIYILLQHQYMFNIV